MNQGCVRFLLLSVVVFAALTAAWAFALMPTDGELPLERAAILGLLGLGTVLSVKSLLRQRTEIRLLEDAQRGIPPADGKRGAAIGELHPTTDTVLTAPFSAKPALVYSYVVSRMAEVSPPHGKRHMTTVKAYEGDAMAPCEVRTAFGAVRILEPPTFAAAGKTHEGAEAVARATAYLDAAPFAEVVSPGTVGEMRRKVEAEERESLAATGGYRYDGRISNPGALLESPIDLRAWELSETRFAPGESVTLLGRYDDSRCGFTAVPTDVLAGVALYKGSVTENVRRKRMGVRFLASLVPGPPRRAGARRRPRHLRPDEGARGSGRRRGRDPDRRPPLPCRRRRRRRRRPSTAEERSRFSKPGSGRSGALPRRAKRSDVEARPRRGGPCRRAELVGRDAAHCRRGRKRRRAGEAPPRPGRRPERPRRDRRRPPRVHAGPGDPRRARRGRRT